jgi:hypothetical protein
MEVFVSFGVASWFGFDFEPRITRISTRGRDQMSCSSFASWRLGGRGCFPAKPQSRKDEKGVFFCGVKDRERPEAVAFLQVHADGEGDGVDLLVVVALGAVLLVRGFEVLL